MFLFLGLQGGLASLIVGQKLSLQDWIIWWSSWFLCCLVDEFMRLYDQNYVQSQTLHFIAPQKLLLLIQTLNTSLHSDLLTHQCLHLFNYHATLFFLLAFFARWFFANVIFVYLFFFCYRFLSVRCQGCLNKWLLKFSFSLFWLWI